jgi:hypothetical protein
MVAALANPQTIFSVLGAAARRRSSRALALQLLLSTGAAVALLVAEPRLWFCAALLGVPASYAAWGLLTATAGSRARAPVLLRMLAVATAVAGTLLAFAGTVGLALALFTGHGRSPYDACGPGSNSAYCQATMHPPEARAPLP